MPTGFLQQAPTGPTTGEDLIILVETLTNWLFVGFMLVALLFILFAAAKFIAQGGDPRAIGQERNKLMWAAVAIGIALLARAVVPAIGWIVGL
ncbi:MAG TPA: hypothetical protein VFE94_03860 [Candidatus Paceibacterota bacterium]|nr:hypothetical protein [Candidatus Paceibacterota bacterium]